MSDTVHSPSRTPRRFLLLAGALVLAAAIGTTVWLQAASAARGDIRVLPRSMHCGVHDVPYVLSDENDLDRVFNGFDVTLRPRSFCQLELTFVNDGSRTVHVDSATFSDMGSGDAAHGPLEVTQNGGQFNTADTGTNPETGDAVIPVDADLHGGESMTWLFDMRTRASSFRGDPDLTSTYDRIPTVKVSHWGRSGDVDGSVGLRIREKP